VEIYGLKYFNDQYRRKFLKGVIHLPFLALKYKVTGKKIEPVKSGGMRNYWEKDIV